MNDMAYNENDTICAIATAPGGALGVIRVSGPAAVQAVDGIFDKTLAGRPQQALVFGHIMDGGEVLDEVLVSLFHSPHSYTGEDVVELSCHGSAFILQRVLELLVEGGCRMAEPGEFTRRAFLNGKMDLSQAEAVADLIASSSAASHRMAMQQMRGDFSNKLRALREQLLTLTSLLELELDFSDHEDLEFADRTELKRLCSEVESEVGRLADSFRLGNALKRGIPVAIVGQSNAGKSTLLNALVGEDKAIVSAIQGTTRDAVEDCVNIGGTLFRFVDTAGIRNTSDEVEQLGIERTFSQIERAEIVFWTSDITRFSADFAELSPRILPLCEGKQLVFVLNKCDLSAQSPTTAPSHTPEWQRILDQCPSGTRILLISAKQGAPGIHPLTQWLAETAHLPQIAPDTILVSNVRHYKALTAARQALQRTSLGLASSLPGDLIAQDLRECLHHLSDIIGEVSSTDLLSTIFSRFCIGK